MSVFKSKFSRKAVNFQFSSVLLFIVAFFAPWGEATGSFFGIGFSKLFVVGAVPLVMNWLLFSRPRFKVFPGKFNLLVLFLIAHTIFYYLIFNRGLLEFGYGQVVYLRDGFATVEETMGMTLLRFILFIGLGYALARYLDTSKKIVIFCIAYGLGLCTMMLLFSGYSTISAFYGELRYAGGFLNANAFAMSASTAFFLMMFAMKSSQFSKLHKIFLILMILLAVYGLLSSGSRSGLIGFLLGVTIITFYSPLRNMSVFWLPAIFLIFTILLTAFVPEQVFHDISKRLSIERMASDRGAKRLDIWDAYLKHTEKYVFQGVGLNKGTEVVTQEFGGRERATHNLFLKILVEFGAIGLVLFVLGISQIFKIILSVRGKPLERAIILALFISWLVNVFFHDFLTSRDTWIILGFVCAFRNVTPGDSPVAKNSMFRLKRRGNFGNVLKPARRFS